jgi:hypothetical protein
MLDKVGFQILDVQAAMPFHIILLAHKCNERDMPRNSDFLGLDSPAYQLSPFQADRLNRIRAKKRIVLTSE